METADALEIAGASGIADASAIAAACCSVAHASVIAVSVEVIAAAETASTDAGEIAPCGVTEIVANAAGTALAMLDDGAGIVVPMNGEETGLIGRVKETWLVSAQASAAALVASVAVQTAPILAAFLETAV